MAEILSAVLFIVMSAYDAPSANAKLARVFIPQYWNSSQNSTALTYAAADLRYFKLTGGSVSGSVNVLGNSVQLSSGTGLGANTLSLSNSSGHPGIDFKGSSSQFGLLQFQDNNASTRATVYASTGTNAVNVDFQSLSTGFNVSSAGATKFNVDPNGNATVSGGLSLGGGITGFTSYPTMSSGMIGYMSIANFGAVTINGTGTNTNLGSISFGVGVYMILASVRVKSNTGAGAGTISAFNFSIGPSSGGSSVLTQVYTNSTFAVSEAGTGLTDFQLSWMMATSGAYTLYCNAASTATVTLLVQSDGRLSQMRAVRIA